MNEFSIFIQNEWLTNFASLKQYINLTQFLITVSIKLCTGKSIYKNNKQSTAEMNRHLLT